MASTAKAGKGKKPKAKDIKKAAKLLSSEDVSALFQLAIIYLVDADHNGQVSMDELKTFVSDTLDVDADDAESLMLQYDENENGVLELGEFLCLLRDREEFEDAIGASGAELSAEKMQAFIWAFEQFDANESGKLDFDEFQQAMQLLLPSSKRQKVTEESVRAIFDDLLQTRPNMNELDFAAFLLAYTHLRYGEDAAAGMLTDDATAALVAAAKGSDDSSSASSSAASSAAAPSGSDASASSSSAAPKKKAAAKGKGGAASSAAKRGASAVKGATKGASKVAGKAAKMAGKAAKSAGKAAASAGKAASKTASSAGKAASSAGKAAAKTASKATSKKSK